MPSMLACAALCDESIYPLACVDLPGPPALRLAGARMLLTRVPEPSFCLDLFGQGACATG